MSVPRQHMTVLKAFRNPIHADQGIYESSEMHACCLSGRTTLMQADMYMPLTPQAEESMGWARKGKHLYLQSQTDSSPNAGAFQAGQQSQQHTPG